MKRFCTHAIETLSQTTGPRWAEEFVRLRMKFHRIHGHGLILSTWHGIDFFENLLNAIKYGECFNEPKGEYRNNFLKLVAIGMAEA